MSLKILQLVPESLPTFRPDVAVLFGKYLPRHGVECDIVGMPSQQPPQAQGFRSVRHGRFLGSRLLRELAFQWLCLRALAGARRAGCDAIQVRDMVPTGLLALLVARLKGIPFYYWVSYLISEGRIERARSSLAQRPTLRARLVLCKGLLEQWLLYRIVLPRANHVFVQSDAMLRMMQARGIAAQRLTAVPMGVDMEVLQAQAIAPVRPEGWEEVSLLAYLGTLDQSRQLERLLDALLIVRQRIPAACLLLIGASDTPSDVDDLLAYAQRAGLAGAVRVTGWLPSDQAWPLLAGADAALSYIPRGALFDVSSPTKLLEYLALRMPAVGNDSPDQAEVLTASGAGWLTASEPAAMAAAMAAILSDVPAARARAQAGVAYIEARRSYRVLAQALAQRYLDLAGARR
ncbi:glycosyltransferase [Janthinobacterium kumbetense]|uniref:Glycosyltransferase n=1 Tax=Janthinobacterium kumbetense TaxID=2950280 RepID=A0ABT0WT88_9BURK|nr:glycosyltransferase [Janthinobacterium kumbetense]MCM2566567.1 glycosyltransferase [Janthinobacterium kumbetense]